MHFVTTELIGPDLSKVANSGQTNRGLDGFQFAEVDTQRFSLRVGELGCQSVKVGTLTSSGHRYCSQHAVEDWFGITFPLSGSVIAETRHGVHKASAGQWIVLAPGRRDVVNKPDGDRLFRSLRLLVSWPRIAQHLAEAQIAVVTDFRDLVVPADLLEAQTLRHSLARLAGDSWVADRSGHENLEGEVVEQAANLLIASNALAPTRSEPPASLGLVRRAEEYIRVHAAEDILLSRVADELAISPRSLQLSFKTHRGYSPHDYLETVRLERAHQRLLTIEIEENVTRIALDAGFSHLGRFAHQYRLRYHQPPSETANRSRKRAGADRV